ASDLKRGDYITQEWLAFIRGLSTDLSPETMAQIDEHLNLSMSANRLIKSEWYQLGIKAGYKAIRPFMEEHLALVGRRWLIEGVYQELHDSKDKEDLVWAKDVFERVKGNYHFVARSTVEEILYN
ncbi:MAG: leukotriene-A4 hydrolase, partial [Crocinitomicaceae bacterium]